MPSSAVQASAQPGVGASTRPARRRQGEQVARADGAHAPDAVAQPAAQQHAHRARGGEGGERRGALEARAVQVARDAQRQHRQHRDVRNRPAHDGRHQPAEGAPVVVRLQHLAPGLLAGGSCCVAAADAPRRAANWPAPTPRPSPAPARRAGSCAQAAAAHHRGRQHRRERGADGAAHREHAHRLLRCAAGRARRHRGRRVVGRNAQPAQRNGDPGQQVALAQARQHHAQRRHQEPGGHQPAARVAVGVQAEQRLHHARQAGGRQHQPAHRRVAVAALQHHERQQGGHEALVEVIDGMGAGEQPESALVHSIASLMSIEGKAS
jgi:hypothetical protein